MAKLNKTELVREWFSFDSRKTPKQFSLCIEILMESKWKVYTNRGKLNLLFNGELPCKGSFRLFRELLREMVLIFEA